MRIIVEPHTTGKISSLISLFSGENPKLLYMLDYCQNLGEVYTGFIDGDFICCWGLIPPSFLSNQAYLWMWAPEPMKHQLVFIRHSQIQVQRMLTRYEKIVGDCQLTARSARRWLLWLGAEFGQPHRDLIPFTIRRAHG